MLSKKKPAQVSGLKQQVLKEINPGNSCLTGEKLLHDRAKHHHALYD